MHCHLSFNNLERLGNRVVRLFFSQIVLLITLVLPLAMYSDGKAQTVIPAYMAPSGPLEVTFSGKILNLKSAFPVGTIGLQTEQDIYKNIEVNAEGIFSVTLPENLPLSYKLFSDKDFLNGVNVGDIIKIQNYILAKNAINDPLSLIAADVNKSGKVTVADIVELRKLILGKIDQFSTGDSWVFIDADFPLFINNWELANTYVSPTDDNDFYNEFLAVKVGDVDRLIFSRQDEVAVRNLKQKEILDLSREEGKTTLWLAKSNETIDGLQLSLDLDPDLHIYSINPLLEDNQYSINEDGRNIRIVLTADEMSVLNGQPLFVFDEPGAKSDNATLKLTENFENMVVSDGEFYAVAPISLKENPVSESYVSPNPFKNNTSIYFKAEAFEDVQVTVYDVNGRVISEQKICALPGQNSFSLTGTELSKAGMYFYSILGKGIQSSGKIMMLD